MRHKAYKKTDRAYFIRTANGSPLANSPKLTFRGGIRL